MLITARINMIFHDSIYHWRLTKWPAPSWLDSSVGRALHRYRRGHGFESCGDLNFFSLQFYSCWIWELVTATISHVFIVIFILCENQEWQRVIERSGNTKKHFTGTCSMHRQFCCCDLLIFLPKKLFWERNCHRNMLYGSVRDSAGLNACVMIKQGQNSIRF